MKHQILFAALTLAVSPLLISGEGRGTEIAFNVSSGTTLTKTFEVTTDVTMDSFDMTMNGQEPPMMPSMDLTLRSEASMVFEDTYSAVSDGRPTSISRTYETLGGESESAMEMEIMGETQNEGSSAVMSSVLEGESVEFNWDEKAESYAIVLPDGSPLEEEDAEGLLEDTDFRALLPDGEVSEGDEWEIDISKLRGILSPGGNTLLIPEETEEDASSMGMGSNDMGDLNDYFNEDCEGEFTAVFDGMQKTDDGEFAAIKFTFEISNAVDITERVQESLEGGELPEGVGEMEVEHVDLEVAYEGEGVMLWDLKAGHFHSYEASGDFEMLTDQGMLIEAMGQEMAIEQTMEFSGSLTYSASAE
jgi:hypothetical protein